MPDAGEARYDVASTEKTMADAGEARYDVSSTEKTMANAGKARYDLVPTHKTGKPYQTFMVWWSVGFQREPG